LCADLAGLPEQAHELCFNPLFSSLYFPENVAHFLNGSYDHLQQNTVTAGEVAAVTESKTLSDVVKGVNKSSATGGDKPHASSPATSTTSRQQPPLPTPLTPAPHVVNCDGEAAAAPVSNTVSVIRGR
jgi:hypothetical protein